MVCKDLKISKVSKLQITKISKRYKFPNFQHIQKVPHLGKVRNFITKLINLVQIQNFEYLKSSQNISFQRCKFSKSSKFSK